MLYLLTYENKDNINDIIKKSPNLTILFYWNMCGHCAALKPIWDKVSNKYKKDYKCCVLNVEVSQLKYLKAKYKKNINGFPTILKYKNGKKINEYNGERTLKDINKFVKS
jgi:thioredoxin domain-containing protein 5